MFYPIFSSITSTSIYYIYVHRSKPMSTLIVPEEGRFGQPKYSTPLKSNLRCIGSCSKYLFSQYTAFFSKKSYLEWEIFSPNFLLWGSPVSIATKCMACGHKSNNIHKLLHSDWLKAWPNACNIATQHLATLLGTTCRICCDMLQHFGSNLKTVKFFE